MSRVSTGQPVPVLCSRHVAHRTFFLSRQRDVIAFFVWCMYWAHRFCWKQVFCALLLELCLQASPKNAPQFLTLEEPTRTWLIA